MLTIFKYLEDGHGEEEFMIRWLFRLDTLWHHGKQKDFGINIRLWLYSSFVMYLSVYELFSLPSLLLLGVIK